MKKLEIDKTPRTIEFFSTMGKWKCSSCKIF